MKTNIFCHSLACAAIALATASLTGCNDFLDTLPLNDVVLENFWTQKADVSSVVNSCYESLESNDNITRMAFWGELRSDNIVAGASTSYDVSEILKENLLPNSTYCSWASMYTCINYCNTVIHYAPGVAKKDPNYTEAEMHANIAEASALRDLCYFYLIRTFRDVPYSTKPSIDDQQQYKIPASSFNNVLDSIITDLEGVKDWAVRRYYTDDNSMAYYNSSKITRYAIYAMLADMYLWKGDWDNCIKYCDLVIDYKKQQYDEMKRDGRNIDNLHLFDGIPMLLERTSGSTSSGSAYNAIFGTGNSFESIFELYFRDNQPVTNDFVSKYYGDTQNSTGQLAAPDFLRKDVATGNNKIFKPKDCRPYEDMTLNNSRYSITKYVLNTVSMNTTNVTSENDLKLSSGRRSTHYSNWIIYRLSDVLLMKAEAEVMKGGEDNLATAFILINDVNKRANNILSKADKDSLVYSEYAGSKMAMENLLFQERQREFLFEGKRWFDLVRMARRDGNNKRFISLVTAKYVDNVNAIKIKLADPNIIYWPYGRQELKVNPYLHQNPAYGKEDQQTVIN